MKFILLKLIRLYQKTVSPDHGFFSSLRSTRVCRYHPTCSEYAYTAIKRHGIIRGIYLSSKRIFRCTPWHIGGNDPVPDA